MRIGTVLTGIALFSLTAPALAVSVPAGTVTFASLFNPGVNLSVTPATATFSGATFQISSMGGFASSSGSNGTMNGMVSFLNLPGAVLPETLNNFFVFSDGMGGTFNFSATSVQTMSYTDFPGVSQSVTLFLLGTTQNINLGYSPTATSLTLGFNQTAGSGYAASGTLAIPPVVPEPATWAMFIGGFGMVGAAIRYRKRVRVATI